jgi:hypothetical protein
LKRRFDWRGAVVLAVMFGALVWVGVSVAMLVADLSPLLTAR